MDGNVYDDAWWLPENHDVSDISYYSYVGSKTGTTYVHRDDVWRFNVYCLTGKYPVGDSVLCKRGGVRNRNILLYATKKLN